MLPPAAERAPDIDVELLAARFSTTGAEIRNAVMTAALLAADDGVAPGMSHVAVALHRELGKAGRLMDVSAFGPWAPAIAARRAGRRGRREG
jgi:hypothetical protein